eukprot:5687840-Lingulodinium_polyedra.AAC.1
MNYRQCYRLYCGLLLRAPVVFSWVYGCTAIVVDASLRVEISVRSDSDPSRVRTRSDSDQSKTWDTSETDSDLTLIWF